MDSSAIITSTGNFTENFNFGVQSIASSKVHPQGPQGPQLLPLSTKPGPIFTPP